MFSIWNFLSNFCPYNNLINKSSKISIAITSQTNIEFHVCFEFLWGYITSLWKGHSYWWLQWWGWRWIHKITSRMTFWTQLWLLFSGWDWWHREKISSQHHWIIVPLLLWLGLTIEQRKVSNIDRILDHSLAEQCTAKSCIEQQIQINVTIKLWLI